MYNVQDYSVDYNYAVYYMWELAFYSHLKSTCMTSSFH